MTSEATGGDRVGGGATRRRRVTSPFVDMAANMELVRETIEASTAILEATAWQIRLLSKSNLLPLVAAGIPERFKDRVIYGVSTGTLDDNLARAFEAGAPLVSKRLHSLHVLQDRGFRTFGMICPSLPLPDGEYGAFARAMFDAIRGDRCEHVWGEVINVRGDSMVRTVNACRTVASRQRPPPWLASARIKIPGRNMRAPLSRLMPPSNRRASCGFCNTSQRIRSPGGLHSNRTGLFYSETIMC